jgi:ABC-type lipoprotein release transport system permease subunit
MYKLFLCIRYLTRKGIVVFPILVVWLCVMMMIIVASIMGGFVDRVREANRGLMGDIVIESHMGSGWPYYDELQQELKKKVPEVELSTPVIQAYGLFSVPGGSTFAQVIGIWPEERARISSFKQSLFLQDAAPREAVHELSGGRFPATGLELQQRALEESRAAVKRLEQLEERGNADLKLDDLAYERIEALCHQRGWRWGGGAIAAAVGGQLLLALALVRRAHRKRYLLASLVWFAGAVAITLVAFMEYRALSRYEDRKNELIAEIMRDDTTLDLLESLPAKKAFKDLGELAAALIPKDPSFQVPTASRTVAEGTTDGCIIGVDLGLIPRDRKGNYDRSRFRYPHATVTVVPVSARGTAMFSKPAEHSFVVVDDAYTKVYDVDSTYVYVPFDVAQNMAAMGGLMDENGNPLPSRCTELQLKVKDGSDPEKLLAVQRKVESLVDGEFRQRHPDLPTIYVQTWDQKQAKYINAVQNEKRMLTFILGLMSIVVLVVIFLIFWMIVRDKTRDIGIIKALGGSEEGVAAIFLFYGLFVGTVGGVLGGFMGVLFVHNTNWIHDSVLYDIFGVTIWDRSVYLFDRIPDQVNPLEVGIYVVLAILSGGIGALVPAIRAGLQDPVEAVRYE